MVLECQQHPDYYSAITTLLDLAEEYGGHANRIAKGGSGTVKDARSALAQAESDLKVSGLCQVGLTTWLTVPYRP